MALTKTELNRLSTLFAKMEGEDSKVVAAMFNKVTSANRAAKKVAAKSNFNIGDKVRVDGGNRYGFMDGTIAKINRVNVKVMTNFGMFTVSPTFISKV